MPAEPHSDPSSARDAARRFAAALAAEALLDQTARLEATLAADGGLGGPVRPGAGPGPLLAPRYAHL